MAGFQLPVAKGEVTPSALPVPALKSSSPQFANRLLKFIVMELLVLFSVPVGIVPPAIVPAGEWASPRLLDAVYALAGDPYHVPYIINVEFGLALDVLEPPLPMYPPTRFVFEPRLSNAVTALPLLGFIIKAPDPFLTVKLALAMFMLLME